MDKQKALDAVEELDDDFDDAFDAFQKVWTARYLKKFQELVLACFADAKKTAMSLEELDAVLGAALYHEIRDSAGEQEYSIGLRSALNTMVSKGILAMPDGDGPAMYHLLNTPVCTDCNDTHKVDSGMCTRCPVPCSSCQVDGVGPYCTETPCKCQCHVGKYKNYEKRLFEAQALVWAKGAK